MRAPDRTPAAVLTLPSHTRAAVQARRTVAALAGYDPEVADRGQLLVTEAVANAVEHTVGGQVTVELSVDDRTGGMYCAVFDTDAEAPLPAGGMPFPAEVEVEVAVEVDVVRESAPRQGPHRGPVLDGSVDVDAIAESGRGLELIRRLSDDWGCIREEAGKWVWFHLRPAA